MGSAHCLATLPSFQGKLANVKNLLIDSNSDEESAQAHAAQTARAEASGKPSSLDEINLRSVHVRMNWSVSEKRGIPSEEHTLEVLTARRARASSSAPAIAAMMSTSPELKPIRTL